MLVCTHCILCVAGIGLCGQYDLTADQLAANWLGYAATHRLDDMTEDRLDNFDREVLGKKKGNNNLSQKTNSKYRIYTVDTIDQLNTEDDILLSYGAAPSTVVSNISLSFQEIMSVGLY